MSAWSAQTKLAPSSRSPKFGYGCGPDAAGIEMPTRLFVPPEREIEDNWYREAPR